MISYAKTDTGIVRRSNQDFLFASDQPVGPLPNLFIKVMRLVNQAILVFLIITGS